MASYAEVKMFSHYFVSRFEYYELNLTDIQRQFISLDPFQKILEVPIYRFCAALKKHQVHVKETVRNTILVQSLTSIWCVNSSQTYIAIMMLKVMSQSFSFSRLCRRRCLIWLSSHSSFPSSRIVSLSLSYILRPKVIFFITIVRLSKKDYAHKRVLC